MYATIPMLETHSGCFLMTHNELMLTIPCGIPQKYNTYPVYTMWKHTEVVDSLIGLIHQCVKAHTYNNTTHTQYIPTTPKNYRWGNVYECKGDNSRVVEEA